jgi:integrase
MARRPLNRLSARTVQTAKEPGRHADGQGLYLHVDESGAKRWVFVFQWHGKRKEMGLGPVDIVSLGEARDARDDARKLVFQGLNPIVERRRAKGEAPTFKVMAEEVLAGLKLRSDVQRAAWTRSLTELTAPIAGLKVDAIDTEDVLGVLKPIWNKTPETASRTRGRIERVLDAAKAKGYRKGENPARWKGHLALLIPQGKRRHEHHAAMPFADVPAFMARLAARESVGAMALQFTVLTAARSGETIGALWSEIDGDVWTVPPERMKGGREHRVPLQAEALAVLAKVKRDKGFIFPGTRGAGLSNMTMSKALREMGHDVTVHGFRSSFRDWAGEATHHARETIEAALAHVVGDQTERAYRRGDALEKRRKLMEDWAAFCFSGPSPSTYQGEETR